MRWVLEIVRRWPWIALPALVTAVAFVAFLGVAAGVVPVTASSGHWAVTKWFLQFAKRRSVATHAMLAPPAPPDLDSPAMVLRGAGHFETGCRPCHGAPGDRLPPIPQAMTPQPPALADRMSSWNSEQLFYIVKHGVKFTGMPAWPAQQRDDEVWSVVGFLRKLPELQHHSYANLVHGEGTALTELMTAGPATAAPPDTVIEMCARCHGMDGNGRGAGAFPKLAGQRLDYLRRAMQAYADGRRMSGIMQPVTANLDDVSRHEALQYYAALPPMRSQVSVDPAAVARGAVIARDGVEQQEIPACVTCHAQTGVNDAYPRLNGQYPEYVAQQLRLMQQRHRGGSEFVHIMHTFVSRLSEQQIADVAAYFAAQRP